MLLVFFHCFLIEFEKEESWKRWQQQCTKYEHDTAYDLTLIHMLENRLKYIHLAFTCGHIRWYNLVHIR